MTCTRFESRRHSVYCTQKDMKVRRKEKGERDGAKRLMTLFFHFHYTTQVHSIACNCGFLQHCEQLPGWQISQIDILKRILTLLLYIVRNKHWFHSSLLSLSVNSSGHVIECWFQRDFLSLFVLNRKIFDPQSQHTTIFNYILEPNTYLWPNPP